MSVNLAMRRGAVTPLAVIGTVVFAGLAGLGRVPMGIAGILVALGAFAAVLVTLRNLGLGVGLLPFIGIAVPLSIGTGTQSPLVAALLWGCGLLGFWLVRSVVTRDFSIPRSFVFLPTIALILTWTISYLYADATYSPLVYVWEMYRRSRTGQLGVVIISAGVLLLALKVGGDVRWIKLATWTMLIFGTLIVVMFYLHFDSTPLWRAMSDGGLFTLWVVALAYGQALYNDKVPRSVRGCLVILTLAWLYKAIFLQNLWFSGWVPALVAFAVITLFRSPKFFLFLASVSGALVVLKWSVVYHALWDAKVAEGDTSRFGIWDQALELFHRSPILGTGPAGYAAYYQSVFFGSQFSMSTHSGYMDVLIETGVLGVIIFAWFWLAILHSGWKARSVWKDGFAGGFAQGAFGGMFGVLAGMALGDWFIPFVYNATIAGFRYTVHSWIFLGFLAALAVTRPQERAGGNSVPALPVHET